jgi:hypothetical protein
MTSSGDNRFQDFFEDDKYVALKNYPMPRALSAVLLIKAVKK